MWQEATVTHPTRHFWSFHSSVQIWKCHNADIKVFGLTEMHKSNKHGFQSLFVFVFYRLSLIFCRSSKFQFIYIDFTQTQNHIQDTQQKNIGSWFSKDDSKRNKNREFSKARIFFKGHSFNKGDVESDVLIEFSLLWWVKKSGCFCETLKH